ncbi:hypothetical protein RFI_09048, partial [Reticulomyxa filosa]
TPAYLIFPSSLYLVSELARRNQHLYLYIVLRNPIQRAYSGYWWHYEERDDNRLLRVIDQDLSFYRFHHQYFRPMFELLDRSDSDNLSHSDLVRLFINGFYHDVLGLFQHSASKIIPNPLIRSCYYPQIQMIFYFFGLERIPTSSHYSYSSPSQQRQRKINANANTLDTPFVNLKILQLDRFHSKNQSHLIFHFRKWIYGEDDQTVTFVDLEDKFIQDTLSALSHDNQEWNYKTRPITSDLEVKMTQFFHGCNKHLYSFFKQNPHYLLANMYSTW